MKYGETLQSLRVSESSILAQTEQCTTPVKKASTWSSSNPQDLRRQRVMSLRMAVRHLTIGLRIGHSETVWTTPPCFENSRIFDRTWKHQCDTAYITYICLYSKWQRRSDTLSWSFLHCLHFLGFRRKDMGRGQEGPCRSCTSKPFGPKLQVAVQLHLLPGLCKHVQTRASHLSRLNKVTWSSMKQSMKQIEVFLCLFVIFSAFLGTK